MDTITRYREVIKQILNEYAQYKPAHGEIEMEMICDDQAGHYELMAVGWEKKRRVHGTLIHIDIKGDKVWLQHDSTDAQIGQQLIDVGIAKGDIVLGFQPPHRRKHTGFATG